MTTAKGMTLWLALWRATREVERRAHADIAAHGLCLSDFAVLEALLSRGPLRVSDIGELVMLTSGSTSSAIDRLEGRGLVQRKSDGRDGRVRVVELSEAGRAAISPVYASHAGRMEEVFAALDEGERQTLLTLLLKLRRSLRS